MNLVQIEDAVNVGKLDFIDWNQFKGRTFLITGSTGLIGLNLVNTLSYNSREKGLNIKLILPVRNVKKADSLFFGTGVKVIPYELGKELEIEESVDYCVHLASPTSSKYFSLRPVDTLLSNIEGTRALLDWAKGKKIKKLVTLSTMEVYGFPLKGHKVKEEEIGAFDSVVARNSYPISKIASEALAFSYHSQYGVPSVGLRPTQTFGPGVEYDDGRIFAFFMRCALEKRDIVLKSEGKTERPYLYTADCVSAILVALLKGKEGEVYTVANPETYSSIKSMAEMVASIIAHNEIKVVYDIVEDIEKLGYAKTLFMDLDVSKIRNLGWYPTVGLEQMFLRMLKGLERDA